MPHTIVEEPYRTMVLVAQCLGLRISEVMALQWSDFDFANLTVRVQRGIVHGRVDVVKTEYSNDDLPLDSNLCAILQHWKQQCPVSPNGWVFPNPTTLKPYWQESICADHIKPAAVKAGLTMPGAGLFRVRGELIHRSPIIADSGTSPPQPPGIVLVPDS